MDRKHFLFYFHFFILLAVSCRSNSQTELIFEFEDHFLENSGWNVVMLNAEMQIDSTEKVNGKYPLMIKPIKNPELLVNKPISTLFYTEILLPEQKDSDVATLRITSKSLNLDQAIIKFFCMSKEDDIVFCDSININSKNVWSTKSISFSLKETRKLVLGLYAFGYNYYSINTNDLQGLWLDKLKIHFSNDISRSLDNQYFEIKEKINFRHLSDLKTPLDLNTQKISIPNGKSIIGIGEGVHGSKTINQIELELAKKFILHDSCRLLLLELDFFQLMIWNQYVQGRVPEDFINQIRKGLLSTFFSPEKFCDFLVWLREYNKNYTEKVNIQGIVALKYGWENQLFHYLYVYYNNSTSSIIAPLLKRLRLKSLSEALSYAEKSESQLNSILGDKECSLFLYALKKAVETCALNNENAINSYYRLLYRDIDMTENVDQLVSFYLQNDQKACIIAHNVHINKKPNSFLFPHLYSMGYYLHQKYGDKYYALGIYPGKGGIFVANNNYFGEMSFLGDILPNSLESACMQTGLATFFYPTRYLENGLLYYRSIGNQHTGNEYSVGNLKKQLDGIVFVSEIDPIHTKAYDFISKNNISELMQREVNILKAIKKETVQ